MSASLETLRAEYTEQVIGAELRTLLARIVWATAPAYPASEYSDAGVWNTEALEDALHDWLESRLLRRGDLAAMLTSADSVGQFRSMLTTSFGQLLVNRRRRTSATNLFMRTQAMLRRDDRFRPVGRAPRAAEQHWGLQEGSDRQSQLSLAALVRLAAEKKDDELGVVRYGPHSLKSSPILREGGLAAFLLHLLGRAEGTLTLAQIAEVQVRRFNLPRFETVELDADLWASDAPAVSHVEQAEIVSSVLARINLDDVQLLRIFRDADSPAAAAGALDLSAAQLHDRLQTIVALLADYAEDAEEARAAFEELLEAVSN